MKLKIPGKWKVASLIFPDQLFEIPAFQPIDSICILIEETLFFKHFQFHKQKILLHRTSMLAYQNRLESLGYTVVYVSSTIPESDIRKLIPTIAACGIQQIRYYSLADDWLQRRIHKAAVTHGIEQITLPSPGFILNADAAIQYKPRGKKYFQTAFYQEQRKRMNLLLEADGAPMGGKWSFDEDNRKKLPSKMRPPDIRFMPSDSHIQVAVQYVEKHFPNNPGEMQTQYYFPYDHAGALQWLQAFLEERFILFGTYEDAISTKHPFLYHSLLSPMLNIGLLTPSQILQHSLKYAEAHAIPLNSVEGFVRQIIGWREFIRIIYVQQGRKQRTENHLQFTRKLPKGFWEGNTGIAPVDRVIHTVMKTGYCHHIERLMILGNFLLLCETDPDEVYDWFMTVFIDAYDWVMVPNVYGMSQFADGGLMTTKPYISGSNYIKKMSDEASGEWQEVWDALFWRFMSKHRQLFEKNPRMGMLLKFWDKKTPEAQLQQLLIAEDWIQAHT